MRDLNKYAQKCMLMLDLINIEYGKVLAFKINTTAAGRWGQCKHTPEGHFININADLLDERNPEEALIETLLHELLHTCKGCQNHGPEWKRLVAEVNNFYGLQIKRTNSAEEKGLVVQNVKKKIKHQVTCMKCGEITTYTRNCSVTKCPSSFSCKCGGDLWLDF